MTCKDCIHFGVCRFSFDVEEPIDIYAFHYLGKNDLHNKADDACSDFKDKSLFVNLPCNVGDKLYYVIEDYDEEGSNSFVFETKVVSIGFDKDGFYMSIELPLGKFQRGRLKIGVNIFKTYDEAEKKLQEISK